MIFLAKCANGCAYDTLLCLSVCCLHVLDVLWLNDMSYWKTAGRSKQGCPTTTLTTVNYCVNLHRIMNFVQNLIQPETTQKLIKLVVLGCFQNLGIQPCMIEISVCIVADCVNLQTRRKM